MTYIGIDPGKSGALAVIKDGGVFVGPFDERTYIDVMRQCDPERTVACLEHVHSMPGQGVASVFKFGDNFGWIKGVLSALNIPFELVHPQKWKKEFSATSDKNTSIEVCRRLFPDVDLKRTERCKKDHDGCAEALLLAEYARRHFGREKEPCF